MAFNPGDVVLVPFPFCDQLAERARPAVVVSTAPFNQNGDLILAAVTSHAPRFAKDYALMDWQAAGLRIPSTVRMLVATVAEARILHHVGQLTDRDWAEVVDRLRLALG